MENDVENDVEWLRERLHTLYDRNPYVKLLGIRATTFREGYAELSMFVKQEEHTNLYNVVHGGAIASLADTAMGAACATTGKKVVTLEMNMNFIKSANSQVEIRAIGKILHNGKSTMIAEAEVIDGNKELIAKVRGTFFVTGIFEKNS